MKLAKKLMTLGLVGVIGMTALTGCGKKELVQKVEILAKK